MNDYKKGDRIMAVSNDEGWDIKVGDKGTVAFESDIHPYILLDKTREIVGMSADEIAHVVELDPSSEIAQIIEQSITKFDEKIPVDKFEFNFSDEYGRELSHKFEQSEGDYNIIDVIASLRLFLLGVGYSQKDVDEIIMEDRL